MEELKKLRARLRWSQERIGLFLGYTGRKQVSKIETGAKEMGGSASRLFELLKLYGRHAGRLWDKDRAKKIKPILEEKDDGKTD